MRKLHNVKCGWGYGARGGNSVVDLCGVEVASVTEDRVKEESWRGGVAVSYGGESGLLGC